ncbi:hypothetical protein NB697_003128 [Xanthomonas sacchari]|uniref:DUF6216 family protein n=1 Tax=Xanthomonas sacchari TaxID=56458 RepID=UPI00225474B1|nr:DUF6216 family protein [Xanthomonas sacchari]MCW0380282.1 hypothetical protein [Xanthomonas sacchari]
MDWFEFLTREIAPYSVVGILIAAGITCWRAGSFHPINSRLLRFFIGRDEIEDPVIKKSLADQAALVSFRTTHGVRVQTLSDAKKLAEFASFRNISLDLIGKAGGAFDLRKLEVIPSRVPHQYWFALPVVMLLFFLPAGLISLGMTASSDLLVTLKATQTELWLSNEDATLLYPYFGHRAKMTKDDCENKPEKFVVPEGFKQEDHSILCGIWSNSKLSAQLSKEVSKQRRILFVAFGVCLWYVFMAISLVREWRAKIELHEALKEKTPEPEATPV